MKSDTKPLGAEPRQARPISHQRELQIGVLLVLLGLGALVHPGILYTTHEGLLDVGPSRRDEGDDEDDSDSAAAGSMLLVGGVFLIALRAKRS